MRMLTTAFVVAMATTPALAIDLPVAGLTLNTDVEAKHQLDAEATTITVAPELEYTVGSMNFTAGTTLNVWDNTNKITIDDELDHLPVIDFGAEYALREDLSIELGTSYDLEKEQRGEVTLSATFSF